MLVNNKAITACDFQDLDANQMFRLRLKACSEGFAIKVFPVSLLHSILVQLPTLVPTGERPKGQLMCVGGKDVHSIVVFLRSIGKARLKFGVEFPQRFINKPMLHQLFDVPSIGNLRHRFLQVISTPLLNLVNTMESLVRNFPHSSTNTATKMITKDELIDCIGSMTVLELQDFIEVLKVKLNVKSQVVADCMPAKQSPDQTVQAKSSYGVHLEAVGQAKMAVIKTIRETIGLSLKEAKDIADKAPALLKEGLTKEQAETLQAKLKTAGAKINIK